MTIQEILQAEEAGQAIALLKTGRNSPQPKAGEIRDQLDPRRHRVVVDKIDRPDKQVRTDDGDGGTRSETVKVARISLALQKQIVRRAVAFLFGIPVQYTASCEEGTLEAEALEAVRSILREVRSSALDRRIARAVFSFKECAELWYATERGKGAEGAGDVRMRVRLLSPAFGDVLYPYYDEGGDLVAFSREFDTEEANPRTGKPRSVRYFETFTAEAHYLWQARGEGGAYSRVEGYPRANALGKIPVVYAQQGETEWEDVQVMIERLETLLSNFADVNDYHSAPKIVVTGQIEGFSRKGEAGGILEAEHGSDVKYLSWQNAPESVRLEIETLLRNIYSITQTPDLSFEAVKGLGQMSGVALKLLFMDAHLKVQDKREIFDEYLQRRLAVVRAFASELRPELRGALESLEIEAEITPYNISNDAEDLQYWLQANGGKPLISQLESMRAINLVTDPSADYERMQEEAQASTLSESVEPRNY